MGSGIDLAVAGLGLLGGGALGAAIGGALSGLVRWDGARLTALVASFCLVGAGVGVVMIGGASVANVAAMLPRSLSTPKNLAPFRVETRTASGRLSPASTRSSTSRAFA